MIPVISDNLHHTFFILYRTSCVHYDHLSHIKFYDIYRKRLGHFSFQFLHVRLLCKMLNVKNLPA